MDTDSSSTPEQLAAPGASRSTAAGPETLDQAPLPATSDCWTESHRERAPQWTLLELFILMSGAAVTASLHRALPSQIVAAILGVAVIFGWIGLFLEDWEPRWAVVAWRTALVAYLTSILITAL